MRLVSQVTPSFLHLDCLERVLHSAGLISLGNYSSPLLPSCGFQSVKRRHVSRRSEEEFCETPVSGNNSSSCVRRPSQHATPFGSSRRFCNYLPGHPLVKLANFIMASSPREPRNFSVVQLERLEWHSRSQPLPQSAPEPLGDSPQRCTAL